MEANLLYNIVFVLPYINMNLPRVYMCSPSRTPLPPPSLYHPSGSSQCTSPKHPVSCIEPGLAICFLYDIIHVSMPFSQIIPPSPSPTESKGLFYTSVSLLLSLIQGYCYYLSKFHIYALVLSCSSCVLCRRALDVFVDWMNDYSVESRGNTTDFREASWSLFLAWPCISRVI